MANLETEMRKILKKRLIDLEEDIPEFDFNLNKQKKFENMDFKKIVNSLKGTDDSTDLMKKCVEYNFDATQVHSLIKFYFTNRYSPESIKVRLDYKKKIQNQVKDSYKEWCDFFGIEADVSFPNWNHFFSNLN